MFESWKVAVVYAATSNIAKVMGEASRATILTNEQLKQQNSVLKQRASEEAKLRSQIAQTQAVARVATIGFGALAAVSGAAIYTGIRGAADLETAMTGIGIATHATRQQMEMLRQTAFNVSAQTAQSVVDSARVMQIMASSGINNANQLQQIAMPAAKFADVQFLKSQGKVSFEDAARQAIQIAHLYQAYSPKQITPVLDELTKLSFMMPDDLNRFLTQAGYYTPVFRRLGVSDDQSLIAGAFIDRMGLGRGKGGTGLQQFLLHQLGALQLTNHQQQKMAGALGKLGLLNSDGSAKFYQNGHFDIIGSLEQIDKSIQEQTKGLKGHALDAAQQKAIMDIQKALGVQGGRIGFLGTPEALQQLHNMIQQLHDPATVGMAEAQARYMNTLNGRFQQFRTNFSSLLTELMWPWLDGMKNTFGFLADKLHEWQVFLHGHRDIEKRIGAGLFATFIASVVGVGATSVAAAANVWRLNAAILALSGSAGGAAGGAGKVGFLGTILGIIASPFKFILEVLQAPAAALLLLGRGVIPALQWINNLGPMGTRIAGFLLKIVKISLNPLDAVTPIIQRFYTVLRTIALSSSILGLGKVIDVVETFFSRLAGLVKFLPGIDFISMVLAMTANAGPQEEYGSIDDWLKRQAARINNQNNHGGGGVHFHQPQFHFAPGTPKNHAEQMMDHLNRLLSSPVPASRTTGSIPTHPTVTRHQFAH